MSLKFNSDDAMLERVASLPSVSQASVAMRLTFAGSVVNGSNILTLEDDTTFGWGIYVSSSFGVSVWQGTAGITMDAVLYPYTGIPITLGLTMDLGGGGVKVYWGGVLVKTAALIASLTVPTKLRLGKSSIAGQVATRMSIKNLKIWSGAIGILSAPEMLLESQSDEPVKTSGLWANYQNMSPTNFNDSANGNHFETSAGTLATDATADGVLPEIVPGGGGGGGITSIT